MDNSDFKNKASYNYGKVIPSELEDAMSNLQKAINILNSDLKINGSGYCANELEDFKIKINDYNMDINNRIIQAINNL